jgi:nucleoside-diphosphate-sugar epimerase
MGWGVAPLGKPASWITEEVVPRPRNIYGITKLAAENLCLLFHQRFHMPCLILRTSRFFPEEDDSKATRDTFDDHNAKANEYLYRRVDVEDAVTAHLLAADKAQSIGYGCYIISATTPFTQADLPQLGRDAPTVLERYIDYKAEYARRGWRMFPAIDRVYVNQHAREQLGWQPKYDFAYVREKLKKGEPPISPLARLIGKKGYHTQSFEDGPYPVE